MKDEAMREFHLEKANQWFNQRTKALSNNPLPPPDLVERQRKLASLPPIRKALLPPPKPIVLKRRTTLDQTSTSRNIGKCNRCHTPGKKYTASVKPVSTTRKAETSMGAPLTTSQLDISEITEVNTTIPSHYFEDQYNQIKSSKPHLLNNKYSKYYIINETKEIYKKHYNEDMK